MESERPAKPDFKPPTHIDRRLDSGKDSGMISQRFQWRSIKMRVTVFTLIIFVIGIGSLAFYASRMLRGDMEKLLGEQQFSTVSFIAAQVNGELSDRLTALEKIATQIDAPLMAIPAALHARLEQRPILDLLFNGGVIVYRADGTAIADSIPASGRVGNNYMDIDTVAAALKDGKSTIGKPVIGKKLGVPVFGMTTPIRDDQGKVIGALAGVVNLGKPNFLDKVTDHGYGKSGGYLLIAPQHQLIVTATDKRRIMTATPPPGTNRLADATRAGFEGSIVGVSGVSGVGEAVLSSFKTIPIAGWQLVGTLPVVEVFAPISDMQQRMLWATLLLTLLAGGITWWMLRRELAPMLDTARLLSKVAESNKPAHALPISRQDEIGDLIGGFNRLLEVLAQRDVALRESEDSFRTLFETSSDGILLLDSKARFVKCNQRALDLLKMSREQLLLLTPDRISPEFQPCGRRSSEYAPELFADAYRTGFARFDWTCLTSEGNEVFVEVCLTPIVIGGQALLHATWRDITERKRIEVALQKNETALKDAQRIAHVGGWQIDLQSGQLSWTEEVFHIHELPVGKSPTVDQAIDYYLPESRKSIEQAVKEAIEKRHPFNLELQIKTARGNTRWVHARGEVRQEAGAPGIVSGTFQDITERKQAEDVIKVSEQRFRDLVNTTDGIVWEADATTFQFTFVSERAVSLLGFPVDDWAQPGFWVSRLHPDDATWAPGFCASCTGRLEPHDFEYRFIAGDGRTVWLHDIVTVVAEQGSPRWLRGIMVDITERKRIETALQKNEATLNEAQRIAHVGSWEHDLLDNRLIWSEEIFRIFEIDKARFGATYAAFLDGIHPADREAVNAAYAQSLVTQKPYSITHRLLMPDGRIKYVHEQCESSFDTDGKPLRSVGIVQDVTERVAAQEKLQLAASVFRSSREGIMITDTDGTIIDVNDAFTRITGYGRDEAVGKNPRILNSGRHGPEHYAAMWRDLKAAGHWQGEVWNRRKNGEVYAEMQTISTVRDPEGNARQYVSLFSDITPLKEHQAQLEHIAHYDALTSLPNRVLLADRLHQAMTQARRRKNALAVVFLDLDGFKAINDNHGHEAGDALLIAISARMKDGLREGDTLARIGGDEFVAVLVDLSDAEDSVPMLSRLLAAAAEPVHIGELTLQVSASLGVTFFPQEEDLDADQLQRQADQAMYQAKVAGKNRYHVFDAVQDRSVRGHHESIEDIRRALVEREFILYYQPKVNLRSGAVVGAEALIRWQHPQQGLLAPAAFLPVIEDHPLAIEIGEWVIESALTQMETWRTAGLDLPVSVNVGARQLQQPDFVERLHTLLMAHPAFRPGDLEIEVLETSALEDIARVSTLIEACRELGVAFSLDDFGTGYSSLTYLKRLAVTVLKIDRSFVRDMLDDPDDLAILEGVIGLASAFRRVAIAEGVETVEHGEMLLQLGCDLAQGYGIARPMPADQMPGWAAAWRTPPAWANCQQASHGNRPLLHAAVEHRAWIVAEERYLKGERATPPPLDPRHCRFGLWLDAELLAGRGAQPGIIAIDTLHQQVHALADELCQLRTEGRAPESVARLGELYSLRDALLGQMKALETSR